MSQELLTATQTREIRTQAGRRPTRLRAEADAALREMAYVLQLTRRVRAEILNAEPEIETVHA